MDQAGDAELLEAAGSKPPGGQDSDRAESYSGLFDAHCHPQLPRMVPYQEQMWAAARRAGVVAFVANATSELDWDDVASLAAKFPGVVLPAYGIHPWFLATRTAGPVPGSEPAGWQERLRARLRADPAATIGESGLDGLKTPEGCGLPDQEEALRDHLRIAQEFGRPISLHCVKAHGRLLGVLGEFGWFAGGVVLHGFSGPAEMIPPFLNHNVYFSYTAAGCTNENNKKLRKALTSTPRDRILLESDCPDQPPRPGSLIPHTHHLVPHGDPGGAQDPGTQGPSPPQDSSAPPRQLEGGCPSTPPDGGGCCWPVALGEDSRINTPASIALAVAHIAPLLGLTENQLRALTFENTARLFHPARRGRAGSSSAPEVMKGGCARC